MEGFAEVNGARLWHRISGDGEPVLQIHGAGFGHSIDPVTPLLAERFRVVYFDNTAEHARVVAEFLARHAGAG